MPSDLAALRESEEQLAPGGRRSVVMGKGDPNKPRDKMSSYAFFVQMCREEHKKKHPDYSVSFTEFSKKCSERWKTMSAKEKSKFENMAKSDKARYDREMKNYVPPKGDKKGKKKDPNAPKRPPSAFFLFCSEHGSRKWSKCQRRRSTAPRADPDQGMNSLCSNSGPREWQQHAHVHRHSEGIIHPSSWELWEMEYRPQHP
nr:high mobility group protein B2-like [Oryctolagus cuniculus]